MPAPDLALTADGTQDARQYDNMNAEKSYYRGMTTPRTPAERMAMRIADVDRAIAAELDADDIAARKTVCENAMIRATRSDVTLAPRAIVEATRLGLDLGRAADRVDAIERYEFERSEL